MDVYILSLRVRVSRKCSFNKNKYRSDTGVEIGVEIIETRRGRGASTSKRIDDVIVIELSR
jgi:hypothetical protein